MLTTIHEIFATKDKRFDTFLSVNNTMSFKICSIKIAIFALFLLSFAIHAAAQTVNFPAPREEKLLNGLRLLVWNEPQAAKVSVKLRIHSGAAFDQQTKEGTMSLLSEILFPNDAAKEYFTEDLNGSFEIVSNYDYIQINITGDNDKILEILEPLSAAVQNTVIDKETTAKIKAVHLAKVQELEKNPAYIADQAVAKRLFGNFPYGRPQLGSSESIAKIDFADILLAKQKFLTSDNATLAVSGNVKPEFIFRACKRYFGGWLKTDKKIPSTFTSPDAPDTKTFLTRTETENTSELRYAFRGLARNDKDFGVSQILTRILQNRLTLKEKSGTVRQESHFLPGVVVFELPKWNVGMVKIDGNKISLPVNFFTYITDLLKPNVETSEFDKAKSDFLSEFNRQSSSDFWLDNHTFKFLPIKDEVQKTNNISLADTQRILENWRTQPITTSLVVTAPK